MSETTMRSVLLVCAGSLALFGVGGSAWAQSEADRAAIETLVSDQYRTFGNREAEAYGELFTPTATFITVEGMKMDGRQEIIEGNAGFFRMVDAEKNDVTFKNVIVNFIDEDTAVTYSVWDGLWTKPAINDRAQSGYLTMVVEKTDGRWLIASATNAFNWRGTPAYDLTEYDVLKARMAARTAPPAN